MPEIFELPKLWQNKRRSSENVKRIASVHLADLDRRIAELVSMKQTLVSLVHCCHGDHRTDCPIVDEPGQEHFAAPAWFHRRAHCYVQGLCPGLSAAGFQ